MDVRVGDQLQMKKAHPCGGNIFDVLRIGADFKIRCSGCGREMILSLSPGPALLEKADYDHLGLTFTGKNAITLNHHGKIVDILGSIPTDK